MGPRRATRTWTRAKGDQRSSEGTNEDDQRRRKKQEQQNWVNLIGDEEGEKDEQVSDYIGAYFRGR